MTATGPRGVLSITDADPRTASAGLGGREAERRLRQYGANKIQTLRRESRWHALGRQLVDPLAVLLWVATAFSVVEGSPTVAIAIVGVILVNAGFAYVQELQAERAADALRAYMPSRARVRRDGRVTELDAALLVPGDVIVVGEGDRLSADARILDGTVEIDASPLTGESQPVARSACTDGPRASGIEAEDLLFAGTLCTSGEATAVVQKTGMSTQLGRIAALSQRVEVDLSPLQRQVNKAAKLIAVIAVATGIVFFALGTFAADLPLADSVTFAIGILVAFVPEGLLPTITLALAVAARRMARRQALVKRLAAVETLGCTNVICTDKTGTLTEGRMAVAAWWSDAGERSPGAGEATGEPWASLLHTAVRCNSAAARRAGDTWERSGDPTESALLVGAARSGSDIGRAQAERTVVRRRLLPFDARLKRMTTLDEEPDGQLWWHAKGAPLELLERCDTILTAEGGRPLTAPDRERVRRRFDDYARNGLRVLGLAQRQASADADDEDRGSAESGLVFAGLVALEDPPRPGVAEAVGRCRAAGVRILVITGDHGATAGAVAKQVGIVDGDPVVVTGAELERLDEFELDALLRGASGLVIARSNPETKLRVVDSLRAQGEIVAMTGDGVNDAPALRRADIGVAMGASGTDVAREASTMVLVDDSFASIAAAVEEGRVVYDNLRKFITFVFAHLPPEVLPFLLFALSGGSIPLGLTALQILAIELGTETVPALALAREPGESDVMRRPPRPRAARLIDRAILTRAWLWLGLVEAALAIAAFFWVLNRGGWSLGAETGSGAPLHETYLQATTMTFAAIVMCQAGAAIAARTERGSLRSVGLLTNRPLLAGIAFQLAFGAGVVYLPPLQAVFGTTALGLAELGLLATFPFIVWGTDELRKAWLRRHATRWREESPGPAAPRNAPAPRRS